VLLLSLLWDAGLGENAIAPGGCVFYLDSNGNIIPPQPMPGIWIWIAASILLQGLLIFGLLRFRGRHEEIGPPINTDEHG
jgi:hypothetical protein